MVCSSRARAQAQSLSSFWQRTREETPLSLMSPARLGKLGSAHAHGAWTTVRSRSKDKILAQLPREFLSLAVTNATNSNRFFNHALTRSTPLASHCPTFNLGLLGPACCRSLPRSD
ncbi:hypothetical protein AMAG_19131 [Allomyces macrogynus ATCC 38327]|uniref:Uncharacterized protein n=1 Tax=Allomyces macrogynus (strain ATCC 38327) TaxID=578462 RepID=A0A0L0SPB6_ALLM3|nr:hypothetical protein AMAG_19131 [Allomyces macrogynus ATCC 38327]|eukprot:KNE64220.1 hypothetical protein AMAG_19131 [Allomyces macrogynus ATCC 38327]